MAEATNGHPAWSPDGERVAFYSDRSGSYRLWMLSLASGEVEPVFGEGE